jgi:hypothetical protein
MVCSLYTECNLKAWHEHKGEFYTPYCCCTSETSFPSLSPVFFPVWIYTAVASSPHSVSSKETGILQSDVRATWRQHCSVVCDLV